MNVLYAQTCEELDCPQDIVAKLEEKAFLASQVHVRARRQLRLAKDRVRAMVECQDEEL